MRVLRGRNIIGASVEYIGLCSSIVVSLQQLSVERYFHVTGRAGSKLLGLGKAHKLDGRFFHLVVYVVLSIRRLGVYLNDVLAGYIAVVGDVHRYRAYIAVPLRIEVAPYKVGIGKSVTEGIAYLGRIIEVAGIALIQHIVFVPRFVVLIADVYALFIGHIVDAGILPVLRILEIAVVLRRRRSQKVGGKRIYEVARRVYAALLHYAGQRIYARTARTWNKEHGVDVFIIFEPAHLYRVAAVNDNHDIVEIIIEIAYYAKFYRIRFKVVL